MKSVGGIFVQATEEQLAEIWEACAAHGFPLDQTGILALIMLAVHGDEDAEDEGELEPEQEGDIMSKVMHHLMENPEQVAALRDAAMNAIKKVLKPRI